MKDLILQSLVDGHLNKKNISFSEIMKTVYESPYFTPSDTLWKKLDRGRAIIDSEPVLNQYLNSLGPMILSQWKTLLNPKHSSSYRLISEAFACSAPAGVEIIDYGCGQGTGAMMFHEAFHDALLNQVISYRLIDLSTIALRRAKGVTECCFPNAKVIALNKSLDDLNRNDITINKKTLKIHIFSNILDIASFNLAKLFDKVVCMPGEHIIIAVSQDRDFKGGSPRVKTSYKRLVEFTEHADFCTKRDCGINYFKCINSKKSDAITFCLQLERYNGSFFRNTETKSSLYNT